jgi:phosphoenolpyruvate phosphomutase
MEGNGMNKCKQLKSLIVSPKVEFLLEAHNGLSARIVQNAGFRGIWASGLSISASLGLRDNNEASWTQILTIVEFMSDCTSIPILLDGDTGYGNFNNFRRLVKKLEQAGVAGVCIEDKLFPKTNSFIGGEQQPLAQCDEFCGKIKAGKDTQQDGDFCIVARTEAFIAGWGIEEALNRAQAYADAGADAILVHSKLRIPKDIFAFMARWDNLCPIVIVPTAYHETPTEAFEQAGISLIIWANHMLRSAIAFMEKTARSIHRLRSIRKVEKTIAPMAEVFRLQNMEEYREAERRYLPQVQNTRAVILASARGSGFGKLTQDRPKCMMMIEGRSLLERQVEVLNLCGIKDISVVVGYKRKAVDLANLKYLFNPDYARGGILQSYLRAADTLEGPCILSFGDILYEAHLLRDLLEQNGDIVLAVDTSWWQGFKPHREIDAVIGDIPPADAYLSERSFNITDIGVHIDHPRAHGEWIGLIKLSSLGAVKFKTELNRFRDESEERFHSSDINDFIMWLIQKDQEVKGLYFRGHWLDVDGIEDLSLSLKAGKGSNYRGVRA